MAIIHGTSGNDNLVGTSANDSISGFDGNDTLDGGAGADTLTGGAGDDHYFVEADQIDTVVELAGEGTDTVETADDDFVLGANIENLVVTAQDVHIAQGNALNNEITGGSGFGYLAGEGGDDTLNAGDGGGVLFGGDGSDLLLGGAGDDDLQGDTMNSGPSTSPGNDTLDGGAGDDTLTGGEGQDFYVFSGDFGADTIVESDTSTDIDIVGLADVSPDQLWFSHVSGTDDLLVSVIGTDNQVTLSDWYAGSSHTLEFFQVLTPTQEIRSLARDDVATLVQFMAGFGAAPTSLNSLSEAQRTALNDVVAANWVYWSPAA